MRNFYLVSFLLIWIILIQSCAYSTAHLKTAKGIVKVGMSKKEVLGVWGKPYHKWLPNQSLDSDEWLYPGVHWWGANQITLWFDEKGILKEIELIQD